MKLSSKDVITFTCNFNAIDIKDHHYNACFQCTRNHTFYTFQFPSVLEISIMTR
jgi:hypothetical protein